MPKDLVHFQLICSGRVLEKRLQALREFLHDRPHRLKSSSFSIHVYVPAEEARAIRELNRFMRRELGVSSDAAEGCLERVWAPAELAEIGWFETDLRFQQDGYAGTEYDNTLDVSKACPTCGVGSLLVDRVLTDLRPNPKRRLHQLLTGEWVVSDSTRVMFDEEGIRGATYLPLVSARTGRTLDGAWLLQPQGVAPPADPSASLEQDRHCPTCTADGWGPPAGSQMRFVYAAGALPVDVDFLWTYEALGIRGGKRRLLVSRRVREILRRIKTRGLEFVPVEIVG